MAEYKDKFIAYLDLCGFSKLIEASNDGSGFTLDEILDLLSSFGPSDAREIFNKDGPNICLESARVDRNLDFRLTQISDCVVVSAEISSAGVINLIHHCWAIVFKLLRKGFMCRGYITRGDIYHTDTQFVGLGFQEAYKYDAEKIGRFLKQEEDEAGTPFVEINPKVCAYIETEGDACVKEMFSRLTHSDNGFTALFPFKRLTAASTLTGDGRKLRESIQLIRESINNLLDRLKTHASPSNKQAEEKAKFYRRLLDDQLSECDKYDEKIDVLGSPYPSIRFIDLESKTQTNPPSHV